MSIGQDLLGACCSVISQPGGETDSLQSASPSVLCVCFLVFCLAAFLLHFLKVCRCSRLVRLRHVWRFCSHRESAKEMMWELFSGCGLEIEVQFPRETTRWKHTLTHHYTTDATENWMFKAAKQLIYLSTIKYLLSVNGRILWRVFLPCCVNLEQDTETHDVFSRFSHWCQVLRD